MNERTKQILLVSLFIVSVIGIGAALYFAFFRPERTIPEPTVEEPGTGSLPEAGAGGVRPPVVTPGGPGNLVGSPVAEGGVTQVTSLTTSEVQALTVGVDGQDANFYNPDDGQFYTIDAEGNIVALSDTSFPQASDVAWNAQGDQAVIEFPDGSNIVYNFGSETQITLPSHWEEFAFSPTSNDIIAKNIGIDPNNRSLIISNDDGSNVQSIAALGENADKVMVSWSPNDQVVAFTDTARSVAGALDRKTIIPVGKNEENFKGLVVEGLGFNPLWSDDGKQLLYSAIGEYSGNKPLLWIVDATSASMGENRRSLGINTWADKCTFATAALVYCAVPNNLPAGLALQRTLVEDLPDTLYSIDLETGRSRVVAIPAEETTMTNLSVTADGSNLYFMNGVSGRLELIKLK